MNKPYKILLISFLCLSAIFALTNIGARESVTHLIRVTLDQLIHIVSGKENGQAIVWNATSSKWENGQPYIDTIPNNLIVTGDLKYNFIHAVGSADEKTYSPSVTQNLYTKLVPGLTWHEFDGLTCAGDSVKILTAGDYRCDISITLSGTNVNDFWRVKYIKMGFHFPQALADSDSEPYQAE